MSPAAISLGSNKHGVLIVINCSDYTLLFKGKKWAARQSQWIHENVEGQKQIKMIQCNNTGENHAIDTLCRKKEMALIFNTQHLAHLYEMVVLN